MNNYRLNQGITMSNLIMSLRLSRCHFIINSGSLLFLSNYSSTGFALQVLPSVDVSLLFSPCPSRLQEFLVRMDIVNRTISESFCLNQLSSIGSQWEISSLPGFISICPLEVLLAGQKISCFFKLKVQNYFQESNILYLVFSPCS